MNSTLSAKSFGALFLFIAAALLPLDAQAQLGGGGGGLGGGGGGGLGGGGGGGLAGIHVDASGVLARISKDPTGQLTKQRFQAARKELGAMAKQWRKLRMVSLNRLEAAVQACTEKNQRPSNDMLALAGLTRLQYVFFIPETNDIVVGGQAEPYFDDGNGETRGMKSGRPVVLLEDLIVALRAFAPSVPAQRLIGCSIDPTQEGLQNYNQAVRAIQASGVREARVISQTLKDAMGKHDVSIFGVSPKTRFAHVLLSADYRMKLIGIGLEKPPVRIKSFTELSRGPENMVRWFFTPNYETVRVSDDGLAMQLTGDGVKLVGEDEIVNADGSRRAVGKTTGASKRFVDGFTKKYIALANAEPVYGHLRNLIDLSIAAAYIQQEDFYGQAEWGMEFFADESQCSVELYNAPEKVDTAVNAIWKGGQLRTPIGGGVSIHPGIALESHNLLSDEEGELQGQIDNIDLAKLPADRWWWDAEMVAKGNDQAAAVLPRDRR